MQKRLGTSEFTITPIGLGTWAMGGEGAFGWGPQDDEESVSTVLRAVERGINWIDTAPAYGYGRSERVVGRALAEIPQAERPYVFTKCGLVWDETGEITHSLKADSLRREVEASLERLGMGALDLVQIHWPSFPPGSPALELEQGWTALARLREEGLIREIGVSNCDVNQLQRLAQIAPVTSLQPPYSMLMRQIEDEILPYCGEHHIGVISYSPMHNGLLSGRMTRERIAAMAETDWRAKLNPAFQEPHLTQNLAFVEKLREIADAYGRTVAEVAVAWVLRHQAVTGAIVGARRPDQINDFCCAMEFRLSVEDLAMIEQAMPTSLSAYDLD
ncbi:MAG: aldo/keto reductase [Verrucomicrobiota bacterium]|jgi:aryl-alcohol dehydrogenase-like predicted oxidoreductase